MVRRPKGLWRRIKRWIGSTYWLTARKVAIVLAGVLVIVTVLGAQAEYGFLDVRRLFLDMWANWSAELASIVITVWVIDSLNRRRAVAAEKEDLILQMGSPDNAFALEAVRKLRARGWHKDRALQGARLATANLQGARLEDFDLRRATLVGANLTDAKLKRAVLSGANLSDAILQRAVLIQSDLQRAILNGTDLRKADLYGSDLSSATLLAVKLQGTKLNEATLEGANIVTDDFDHHTIMPDKSLFMPSEILRFTDRSHRHFWRSDNIKSPAYRNRDGKQE